MPTTAHFPGLAGFDSGRPVPPTWEREQLDELYQSLAERREREESDRRIAQEAADAGFICCSCCGAWTRYAEDRCDQCDEPVDAGTDPLYALSKAALEAIGRARVERDFRIHTIAPGPPVEMTTAEIRDAMRQHRSAP